MNKTVFLDIDGVLNRSGTLRRANRDEDLFEPVLVARLNEITDATGAQIVLSSSWRFLIGNDHPLLVIQADPDFEQRAYPTAESLYTFLAGRGITADIVGHTDPAIYHRGRAIEEYVQRTWLDEADYVCLDDCSVEPCNRRWVQTSMDYGLEPHHVARAIAMLGGGRP